MAAKLVWRIETPAGNPQFDSPELDVIASGATEEHYRRFVNWIWFRFGIEPRDSAAEAAAFQLWGQEQFDIAKTNVLEWEKNERFETVKDGPDLS